MTDPLLAVAYLVSALAQEPEFARITFNVPLSAEQGGGTASGMAGTLEYERENYVVASGGVDVNYRGTRIQADRVEIDLATKEVEAEGNVIFDQGAKRLSGQRVEFDLETDTGTIYEAQAFMSPDLYFNGKEIEKVGPDSYVVRDGVLTSCTDETPDWSFRVSTAKVTVEGFARIYNTRMRVKKLPFLYSPFMMFPAKTKRASGLLMPNFGYSERRGYEFGLAWFQTLGESYDTTFFADVFENALTRGGVEGNSLLGLGAEFRYRPSVSTKGIAEVYFVRDLVDREGGTSGRETRWRSRWVHVSEELPFGFRGIVRHTNFSDFDFFRDFLRSFDDIAIRQIESSAYLSGSWGQHSMNLLLEDKESFLRRDPATGDVITLTRTQLPEVEYRLRATQIGNLPLYGSLLSSLNAFEVRSSINPGDTWSRIDLRPVLSMPLPGFPWLSTRVDLASRITQYSDTFARDPETGQVDNTDFSGGGLTRTFGSASASVIGPSFSRVFNKGIGKWAKFKHIVEPRFSYDYRSDFEDDELIRTFDEVDNLGRSQSLMTVALVNRLLAKPKDETELGGSREIMSFQLSQVMSLDKDRVLQRSSDGTLSSTDGPIVGRYRFNPTLTTSLDAAFSYNTLFNTLNSTSLSGRMTFGARQNQVGLSWFTSYSAERDETVNDQVRLFTKIQLWPGRVSLDSQINYDIENSLLQQHRHAILYTSQCWGMRLEMRELKTTTITDRDYRFSISLKNIGTFLDMNSGQRTSTPFS